MVAPPCSNLTKGGRHRVVCSGTVCTRHSNYQSSLPGLLRDRSWARDGRGWEDPSFPGVCIMTSDLHSSRPHFNAWLALACSGTAPKQTWTPASSLTSDYLPPLLASPSSSPYHRPQPSPYPSPSLSLVLPARLPSTPYSTSSFGCLYQSAPRPFLSRARAHRAQAARLIY